jgi:hypothetical protein
MSQQSHGAFDLGNVGDYQKWTHGLTHKEEPKVDRFISLEDALQFGKFQARKLQGISAVRIEPDGDFWRVIIEPPYREAGTIQAVWDGVAVGGAR